jgi:hypothetical protein
MIRNHISKRSLILGLIGAAHLPSHAMAVDLTVASIEVNQADQFGATKLFGNNVTWVRVKIGISGSASPVAGVDATLRMLVDGQPYPSSDVPTYSLNGPITAPLAPASGNLNDTLNFVVIPPVSSNVDFVVEVNPGQTVAETNLANNSGSANDKNFECRKVLEVAYVPINYTPGAGMPPANLIEPGIGDGFLRGIYHPGEWNYHKSPLPPLVWNQSINSSNVLLLNTLQDIRTNQLPEAGYPQPHFVYGWLPGNPFSGNGQAGGVPGDVAFGNTDTTRHQRTMAHELGHCFGLQHNSSTINTIGVDTERHLKDTQNLAQLFPTTKKDVMVAGQLTNAAWIAQNTYTVVHNDSRMQCVSGIAGDPPLVPVLRISGVIDHINRAFQFDPVTRVAKALPTPNHPNANMRVVAFNQAGEFLGQVSVLTGTSRELCVEHPVVGKPVLDPTSPLYVLMPETIQNQTIHRIDIVDLTTGNTLAQRTRSPHAPEAVITQVAAIGQQGLPFGGDVVPAEPLSGPVRVIWNMQDADGDALTSTLLYSPNPGRWLPLVVNSPEQSFEFNAMDVPSTVGPVGKLKLIVTDGLNVTESGVEMMSLNAPQPPETFLITPNTNETFQQHAPIAFHAAVWDMQDLMLTGDQVIWTSDVDGTFGEGLLLIYSDLSPGAHVITVTATDTEGLEASKQINLTITPRTIVDPDCNGNGVLDPLDIASGSSVDSNGDGIPDECATICAADITADRNVDEADLAMVIDAWGQCESCSPACAADLVSTCFVDVDDLLAVINSWGPCDD